MPLTSASILTQYEKNKDLKKDDVKKLMDWLNLQPHLPKISELQAILFLHSCYYSNEATKTCIDNYYTARTHCPEFFANRNPTSDEIQKCLKTMILTPLPKLTPEGYCIFYSKLVDTNPEAFNFNATLKVFDMNASMFLQQEGALQGHVIIIDLLGLTLTHIMKMGVMSIKKYMFFLQEALPFRLKGFHFVNAVPFMDKILALIKPFMKKELHDMLQIHVAPNKGLFQIISKDSLPNEIGGNCGSYLQCHENFARRTVQCVDYFLEEEKMVVDESQRPGKPKDAGDLFGVEGTFKKLDID